MCCSNASKPILQAVSHQADNDTLTSLLFAAMPRLQVVFSSKAALPAVMGLYFGPKPHGPFTPACSEISLPPRTKHHVTFSDMAHAPHRFLKLVFTGMQQDGQGEWGLS